MTLPVWLCAKERVGAGTVHAVRLPPQPAEAARRRCRQEGQRKGRMPSQDTLYLAGWVMVFTTVFEVMMERPRALQLQTIPASVTEILGMA